MTDDGHDVGPAPVEPVETVLDPDRPDRYQPRFDVSGVAPQGGYVAKRCPVRVQFDRFPPADSVALAPSVGARLRMDQGIAFERAVVAELVDRHPGAAVVDLSQVEAEQQASTAEALAAGVPLVIGGWLPTDRSGRRTGRPDLLVRAGRRADGVWGYHPVDVKRHLTLKPRAEDSPVAPARRSELGAPAWSEAVDDPAQMARSRTDDLLQLAHYHRMLEALGHDAPERVGGIVGTEQTVVWHRLDEPIVRQLWDGSTSAREAALQRYDFEFSFRLDVLAAAELGEPIVEPVLVAECAECPWRGHCRPELERVDSTSLLPRIGYREWKVLRRAGIATRAELAGLDDPDGELRDRFAALKTDLDEAVLGARVVTSGGPPALRPGVDALVVPEADVEIDIDMENALDGTVYLWGAWVADRYESFVDWSGTGPEVDARVFLGFWDWLESRRAAALRSGHSIAIYCWYESAEMGALRRGAAAAAEHLGRDVRDDVDALVAGPEWFDLHRVFTGQLVTGTGAGLKIVAGLAGFAWRDSDPSGADSMAWHLGAIDPTDRARAAAARARLLAYNEDDVRATAAVRHWLRSLA